MRIVKVNQLPANAPGVIYCGRPFRGWRGSPLGNPFKGADWRAQYRTHLEKAISAGEPKITAALQSLPENAVLGCWCVNREAPAPDGKEECHCEIIAKIAAQVQARNVAHTSAEG